MGLAVFYTQTADAADSTIETADALVEKVTYDPKTGYFSLQTDGIPAKNMGDDRWYKIYIELPNGEILYSARFVYSPLRYAKSAMTDTSVSEEMRTLCVALMNYGAEAQKYFASVPNSSYTYETLMNTDAAFAPYKNKVRAYDTSMITPYVANQKPVEFAYANSNFTGLPGASLTLTGAIDLNLTFTAKKSGKITSAGMLVWSAQKYAEVETLTLENAAEVIYAKPEAIIGSSFKVSYAGTPAKELGDTIYFVGFFEIDGTTYYSGVVSRHIEFYAGKAIESDATLKPLMEAMIVYGDHAKDYFANN